MKKLLFVLAMLAFASSASAATDTFSYSYTGLKDPAPHADAITPSDTVDVAHVTRRVYVGGAGDIAAIMQDGTAVTFKAVPVGTVLEIRISRVKATGTTATNLVGLY